MTPEPDGRRPVRERLFELLAEEERYKSQWQKYVLRSSGEISFDAVAHVIANSVQEPDSYRRFSRRVADALKEDGDGPSWAMLRLFMDSFGMTRAHCRELRALMRSASGPEGAGSATIR